MAGLIRPDSISGQTVRATSAQIAAGAHALLLVDYEWGVRLAGAGTPGGWSDQAPGALRLLMFSRLQRLDTAGVAAWLAEAEGRAEPAPAAVLAPIILTLELSGRVQRLSGGRLALITA